MIPKRVRFLSDDAPDSTIPIDAGIISLWRKVVIDRLLYEGDANSFTGPMHDEFGRTLIAAFPAAFGNRIAVWWVFGSDEEAVVLALRVSEDLSELDDEEPPVE